MTINSTDVKPKTESIDVVGVTGVLEKRERVSLRTLRLGSVSGTSPGHRGSLRPPYPPQGGGWSDYPVSMKGSFSTC